MSGNPYTLTTLGRVSEKVKELSYGCFDEHVPITDISFPDFSQVNIGSHAFPLSHIAQKSISFRLGIPIAYLKKCPRDVQAYNLNHWIKKERNENLFFRFDGDEVRAIFTPRYQKTDNVDVLTKLDSMGYSSDTPVQCTLDKEFMSLSILTKENNFAIYHSRLKTWKVTNNQALYFFI